MAAIETPTTTAPEMPTFEEAWVAAKAAHAPKDDPAPVVATADADDEPEPTVVEPPPPSVVSTPVATGLISDEEFAALQTKHATDPAALRKSLEGVFTKKTQALAAERTSYERLKPYQALIDQLEADPDAAVAELAERAGYTIVPKGEPPAAKPTETAAAVDTVMADFKKELGPDLEYLADGLAPAITKLVERLTQSSVEQTVAPLRASTSTLLERVANEQTETVMKAFGESHPDWKTHEPAMLALAQKVQPHGLSEPEYLDLLYKTVTRDQWEAEREANIEREADGRFKKRIEKMTKGAAEAEAPTRSVAEGHVKKRPDGPVDFQQAFTDAKNGIRYED